MQLRILFTQKNLPAKGLRICFFVMLFANFISCDMF